MHTATHLGLGRRDIARAGRSQESKGAIRTIDAEAAVIRAAVLILFPALEKHVAGPKQREISAGRARVKSTYRTQHESCCNLDATGIDKDGKMVPRAKSSCA